MEKGRRTIRTDLINSLKAFDCKVYENEPLSKHSSFKVGGPADFFIEIPNEAALEEFLKTAHDNKIRFFVLGGGTNIIFSDKGYRGCVIKLIGDFEKIEIKGEEIICGSGASLPTVLKTALDNKLIGLECIAGVPGTVGGAVFGNAGNSINWIGNSVKNVEVYRNLKKELINKENLGFGYRKSGLEGKVITKINFALKKEARNDILKEVLENIQKRAKSQPLNMPNAGCIFKNPENFSAGKLIEEAGLKGRREGGAMVSDIHANFIVNSGDAKSSDILSLIDIIKTEIRSKFNIELNTEVKIIPEN